MDSERGGRQSKESRAGMAFEEGKCAEMRSVAAKLVSADNNQYMDQRSLFFKNTCLSRELKEITVVARKEYLSK